MPKCGHYKYMLLLVCTHIGCPEAFLTTTEKAQDVSTVLLRQIVPRYGIPLHMGSDNGPGFVHKIVQALAQALQITQARHCAFRP